MRFLALLLVLVAARVPTAAARQTSSAGTAHRAPAAITESDQAPITAYTLPPDLYRKAHTLGQTEFWGQIALFFYSLAALMLVLKLRLGPMFRDWAESAARNEFLQGAIFSPLLVATLDILGIPVDAAQHWISRKYAISVQSWPSWLWDWTKSALLEMLLATFLAWILYAAIRKSPRRWWLYFWTASVPITIALVFAQPLIVDPLFHKFEPLANKDAPLAAALENVVQRSGKDIPVERMFWMGASEKTNALNAYVTGIGSSKRIVVWDTTIAKMSTAETAFVVGHEMGHYALNHVAKGLVAANLLLFALFFLGFRSIGWLLKRKEERWRIRGVSDWASLPALLLLLSIFSAAFSPIANLGSRYIEHQADQYGLEVTHGLFPDSTQVAAHSFQKLGELDLEDPAPNRANVFLFYDHPPIADRVRFALRYNPWGSGGHGEFVP